jgi:prolyl 4-hydroxylase
VRMFRRYPVLCFLTSRFPLFSGECEANQSFMKVNCAPACHTCHLIDMSKRCPPLPEGTEPALRPGDMNKMFERIVATAPGNTTDKTQRLRFLAEGMTDYTVHVWSRPSESPATDVSLDLDMSLPPWVVTFENFVAPEECDKLIELGYKTGYKRSEDVGKVNIDGTVGAKNSTGRTSENAWCSSRNNCREEPLPDRLHKRIAKVLGIAPENSEDFQILKYEVGQFYNTQ